MVKTHTFCGNTYDIDFEECAGFCQNPRPKRPTLYVGMNELSEPEQLRVLIHEALHACDWNKREVMVDQTSRDIARFLWRLNYRKTK